MSIPDVRVQLSVHVSHQSISKRNALKFEKPRISRLRHKCSKNSEVVGSLYTGPGSIALSEIRGPRHEV